MLPALVLVVVYRLGGARVLWIFAVALSFALFIWGLDGILGAGDWGWIIVIGAIVILPPLAGAAVIALVAPRASVVRQTLAGGSALILAAAVPMLAMSVLSDELWARLMSAAALALTFYLVFRRYQSLRPSRLVPEELTWPAV